VEETVPRTIFVARTKLCGLVHYVEVREAVIVIVAPRQTRAHVFWKQSATRSAGMGEMQSSLAGHITKTHASRRRRPRQTHFRGGPYQRRHRQTTKKFPANHLALPVAAFVELRGNDTRADARFVPWPDMTATSIDADEISVMGTGGGVVSGKIAANESGLNLR